MADSVDIKISQDLIKPIIESKIQMAIIDSLGDGEKVIADMVKYYMSQKVDSKGNTSSYHSSSDVPRLEYFAKMMIEEAIKNSVKEWTKENTILIQQQITSYFKSKRGSSMLVDAINSGIVKSLESIYSFQVVINPKTN
jgi:hypothetical protein